MVLSTAYLVTELDSKIRYHNAQVDQIDCKVENLGRQTVSIECKLKEDVDLLMELLRKRKHALQESLWEIVARESRQLAKKKTQILEHIKMLKDLEDMAFKDSTRFRELYGIAAEKSDTFDVGSGDVINLRISADEHKMTKNIMEFGTISYGVCEKGECEILLDDKSEHQSHHSDDDFDVVAREEVAMQKADGKISTALLPCSLADHCNCLGVCEETGLELTEKQAELKHTGSTWEQWLLPPKEPSFSYGSHFAFDNKIASQLESLNLTQAEQAVEYHQQHVVATEVSDSLQYWLASKQKELDYNAGIDEINPENSAVGKVWDEIKARALMSWLKPSVRPDFSAEEKGRAQSNSAHFEYIQSCEKSFWLKDSEQSKETADSGQMMELNVAGKEISSKNLAQYEAVKSTALSDWLKVPYSTAREGNRDESSLRSDTFKARSVDYGVWLKRKLGESEKEPESQTTMLFKRIKRTPLENWLKVPKSQKMEKELLGGKLTSVRRANGMVSMPLEMWLKRMTISNDMGQNKYADWLVPKTEFEKKDPCHNPESMVLQQFDKITKSSLYGWIKKTSKSTKPECLHLCKWLKNKPLEGCKACVLASASN